MQYSKMDLALFEKELHEFDWEPTVEEISLALELNTLNPFRLQFRRLRTIFKSFKAIFEARIYDLDGIPDWRGVHRDNYLKRVSEIKPGTEMVKIPGDVKIITYFDSRYPRQLREIYDPPPVLYVLGDISYDYKTSLSIVGTRLNSDYGRSITEQFSYQLASWGFTIISGGARGIDSISHQGALQAGGGTFAVLGNGIDFVFPAENKKLFEEIPENGALISEFPMGTVPEKFNFPARNRIIAALGRGLLIIEAPERSGALITADLAMQGGKELFVIPGRLTDKRSSGTNKLIQDGAHLVSDPSDITIRFGLTIMEDSNQSPEEETVQLTGDEKVIYEAVGLEAKETDILVREIGLPVQRVLSALLVLQTRGLIKELPGSRFVRPVRQLGKPIQHDN
jgi:DNA processing protein